MSPLDNHKDLFFCEGEIEIRAGEGGQQTVYGYSALFGKRSRTMRTAKGIEFVEEIEPGAFDTTDFSDLEARFNHKVFLAASPTLQFGVDSRGLHYSYQHDPSDPDHVSVLRKIQRGDVKGSSFEFGRPHDNDQVITEEAGIMVRRVKRIKKVYDVGPVVTPAYPQTTAFARSLDAAMLEPELPEIPEISPVEPASEAAAPPISVAATEIRDLSGAYDADTTLTEAQKQAGNFKVGRVRIAGMAISVENPKGSLRYGISPDGYEWSREMSAHYGYILGSLAGDGDNLDVFLSDDAETATVVFVIDQINANGEFDEHKCVIGLRTEQEARELYLHHYPADWTGLGAISCIPIEAFRAWALSGKTKKQPLAYQKPEPVTDEPPELPKLYESYTDALKTVLEANPTNTRSIQYRIFKALHP